MKTNWKRRKGAALVEFALVCPLLLLLVFGIIEFSLLMHSSLTLNQAAREGVRVAALGGDQSAVIGRIQTSAPSLELAADDIHIFHRVYDPEGETNPWTAGLPSDIPSSIDVQLKVTATYIHNMTILGTQHTLTGEMIMRRE